MGGTKREKLEQRKKGGFARRDPLGQEKRVTKLSNEGNSVEKGGKEEKKYCT